MGLYRHCNMCNIAKLKKYKLKNLISYEINYANVCAKIKNKVDLLGPEIKTSDCKVE